MSSETDLYAALAASTALAALVGNRIYPDAIPEDKAPPAVVYQRANTTPVTTISGQTLAEEVRFSVTAWAKTRATADAAGDAIAAALAIAEHPYADRSAGIDTETGLFATAVEVDWFHVF